MDFFRQNSFYVIVANASISEVKLAKLQRVVSTSLLPSEMLRIKEDEYSLKLLSSNAVISVDVVHYKPAPDYIQKMKKRITLQKTDGNPSISTVERKQQ